jgi:hypothetical protein
MIKKTKLILGLVLMLTFSNSLACSCIGVMSVKKAIRKSDKVFIGKIISKEKIAIKRKLDGIETNIIHYYFKVTLIIEYSFKGKIESNIIEVITGTGGGDCGYGFEIDKKYVVYANKRNRFFIGGNKTKTFLYTDICLRTTEKVEEEKEEIEKHRKIRK